MSVHVSDYKTNYIRTLGALIAAPILTTAILYILTGVGYSLYEFYEKGKWATTLRDFQELLIISVVVLIIAFLCTLCFGLPLHCYLAKSQNMRAKIYCFVAIAMTAPLFLIYAMSGAPGILIGGIFVLAGTLCSWLFWFIAVDNQRYPVKRACKRVLALFE